MNTSHILRIFRSIIVLSIITLFVGCGGGGGGTASSESTSFSISGTVGGAVSSGVTVTLSGTSSATTTTDSSGNYTFSSLSNGTYTVTPTLTGYTFSPTSSTKTVSGASITAINFVASIATVSSGIWTWVSGSNTLDQVGVYGDIGFTASTNIPGARSDSVSWTDSKGNFWLFGGYGSDSVGSTGRLNDLWKFEDGNWTWISGANTVKQTGVYGTQGVSASTNVPGARMDSTSWTDIKGNLWFFGGNNGDAASDSLNDLWKFDGANWTWVSGASTVNQTGVYGTKGVAASTNVPGARGNSVSWTDSKGNLWLFGGGETDSNGIGDFFNDLWKFDGANWTWVSGSSTANQTGIYGTKGVAGSTNIPGARGAGISWIDSKGNFWLFGGACDSAGNLVFLNDLWKFDGANWTWVSGASTVNQTGVYGTKGVAASTNVPGARVQSVGWIDSTGNVWLFGGTGYDSVGNQGNINDLWKFDGANWTWVSGASTVNQTGVYGTKGVAASTNILGARECNSVGWIDSSGNLWLFGGDGYDSTGNKGKLNDLWEYKP